MPDPLKLTPEQATQDAMTALKEAGFGKEHGKPVVVDSWSIGRDNFGMGPEVIRTDTQVKRKDDTDAALRALLLLPGAVACAIQGTVVRVHRIAPEVREDEGHDR